MLYDITRRVTPATAVFPGDTPYQTVQQLKMANGASVNLVTVTTSPHAGTHADAYFHYTPDGAAMADMPLDPYIGRAVVVTVTKTAGALVLADLPLLPERVERLLIHSAISDLPDHEFPRMFPYPDVTLIEVLAARGCRLVGLDAPSMDAFDSTDLPGHNAIRRLGMVNLENLALRGVPDGDYELIALPLKLEGACASPVRAVLRTLA